MSKKTLKDELREQYLAIGNEISKLEDAEAESEGKSRVGKCFRYRNSGGGADKKWWLWAKVIKFEDYCIYTQEFQTIPTAYGDELQFVPMKHYYRRMLGGFEPISSSEYRRALALFKKRAANIS